MRVAWFIAVAVAMFGTAVVQSAPGGRASPVPAILPQPVAPTALPAWALYERSCLPCHGAAGDGHGPAAPYTRRAPRDFTTGTFAWRRDRESLAMTITHGVSGTSMPAFAFSPADVDALIDVVIAFDVHRTPLPEPSRVTVSAPPRDPTRGAAAWTTLGCASCHGPDGKGDGPAAAKLVPAPYDLTTQPLHRPRLDERDASRRTAAYVSIAEGIPGTAMPAYATSGTTAELWALADHVLALNATARTDAALPSRAIIADRAAPITIATWPGTDPAERAIFGAPVPAQGPPPSTLAPAEASLAPRQCARCHAKQFREWEPSIHHGAASPGLAAQMAGLAPTAAAKCLRCHAPLAEQQTDLALRSEGASCAGCHVRSWTRHGPPNVSPTLIGTPTYPLVTQSIYERADFCLPCHQLPPRTAVAGKPLLDTYREWLEGPYLPRGIQCQTCHMPNREHTVLGVHDPETFRQAIALTGRASRTTGAVSVVADLRNIGAGHRLPTTPTPAAWLTITLLDANEQPIAGGAATKRIGRAIAREADHWVEREDTRIAPGDTARLSYRWTGGRIADATHARIAVDVSPDDYYERLYLQRLTETLDPARRVQYEAALQRARGDHYRATSIDIALP